MSTTDKEPEFLAIVIPDSAQRSKRRAARDIHRGVLHGSPDVSGEDIARARAALSPDELQRAHEKHAADGHQLGQDPGRREHKTREPRNPWGKRRPSRGRH